MTVVCPSTIRPVLNDFDWVENAGILSSFIPVEKCPSVMTLDCVQKHVSCMTRVTTDYKSQLWLDVLQPK
jgi:hypothetical protein